LVDTEEEKKADHKYYEQEKKAEAMFDGMVGQL